jgi:S1-C subfamily serine protease
MSIQLQRETNPRIKIRYAIIAAVLLAAAVPANSLSAQTGADTMHWQWTQPAEHLDSVVKIEYGNGMGTGVLVNLDNDKPLSSGFEGYCLTAWHVVSGDDSDEEPEEIIVTYRNGKRSRRCKVVAKDERRDIALLWVWVPAGATPAPIATDEVTAGDRLEFAGLGGDSKLNCCLRHFAAIASGPTNGSLIYADVALLPGDSGGPVFNSKREVVGIISGGWFWWDGGVKNSNGNHISVTWPARASNVQPLQSLLDMRHNKSNLAKK